MSEIMIPVLYALSGYIVFQTQVIMAFCVTSDFEVRYKNKTAVGSVIYWLICTCLMLGYGILDYTMQLYTISQVRLVMVWVFVILWKLLFFRESVLNSIFSVFYAAIILFAGNAFCNVINTICRTYNLGILPWLLANDDSIEVFFLISVRCFLLYSFVWAIEFFALRHFLGSKWRTVINKTVVGLYAFLALIVATLFLIEIKVPAQTFMFYMMIFSCELAVSILALIIIVVMELKLRTEKRRLELEADLELIQKLWQLDKKQYEFLKDHVDIINIKCHDLRHLINAGVMGSESVQQEINSLSASVDACDSMIRTGNPVCDITLSNKSMECMKKGIDFICIVDGAALHFVDEVSLYSLLGNAIENAIQHVEQFEDPDKRLITLNISRKGSMVVINVENVLNGSLVFEDDLPRTESKDRNFHGFGMKSMRSTAEKYGGGMAVSAENGMFRLVIVLPYREQKS